MRISKISRQWKPGIGCGHKKYIKLIINFLGLLPNPNTWNFYLTPKLKELCLEGHWAFLGRLPGELTMSPCNKIRIKVLLNAV